MTIPSLLHASYQQKIICFHKIPSDCTFNVRLESEPTVVTLLQRVGLDTPSDLLPYICNSTN